MDFSMKCKSPSRLRQERERRGWSRSFVAEQLEVDIVTVGRWERGEQRPHPIYRQKLCHLFEMNAEDLSLFSELPQEHDEGAIGADSSPEKEEEAPPTSSSWFRQRRSLLIGFGGLAVTVGTGTAWQLASRASGHTVYRPPQSVPSPVIVSKPSQQFIDPNSNNWINHLAWSPSGNAIAAANGLNTVSIWDIGTGGLIFAYPTLNMWVNDISWSKTNWIVAANAEYHVGSLQIWKYPNSKPAVTLHRAYPLRTVSWSPNGTYLAFAGHAITVEVWDPFTARQVSQYSYPALGIQGINRVKWSATGTFLTCGTDDGTVHVWEAFTGKRRTIYRGHKRVVLDVAWSPDERYIASASLDGTTQVWEALTGRTVLTYRGATGQVEGVDWSLQGKYIASGGTDRTTQIWEAFTGRLVAKYVGINAVVETVLWSTDGKTIAVGTDKQGFQFWPVPQ
jgi:transcriptional regulator with XRE-family HTH domain